VSLFELELIGTLAFLIKNQNSSPRYILSLARMFQLGNHGASNVGLGRAFCTLQLK
jgi:hypothetical protein